MVPVVVVCVFVSVWEGGKVGGLGTSVCAVRGLWTPAAARLGT